MNLASALEAIHLEGHNHSVVSRGVKEEDEVERSFKSAWKGQTFYCFIDAKDMGSKELAPHEIKNPVPVVVLRSAPASYSNFMMDRWPSNAA